MNKTFSPNIMNNFTSPWKPSKEFLAFLELELKQTGITIGILWSTKEVREICKNKNIKNVVCYDVSYEILDSLAVWNKNEIIKVCDWFNICWEKFDYIIWDLIFPIIEEKKHNQLISILLNNIAEGWKIILRDTKKTLLP